jgi:hypothetical protein
MTDDAGFGVPSTFGGVITTGFPGYDNSIIGKDETTIGRICSMVLHARLSDSS